ncbi:unnamed protein product [Ambrosiozyma monospora]|uniref:Unnamed protein product n=1 Tax=Ambrosiozyma monospora TaxID=43982 RepID=A0A9W6YQG7_AMBMO|nr:unnamed protein product [Ambrosiozyma monospora]
MHLKTTKRKFLEFEINKLWNRFDHLIDEFNIINANSIDVFTKNEDGKLKVKSILVTDILKHFESVQSVQTPALVTSKKRHLNDNFEIIAKTDGVMPEQAKRMTRSKRITSVVRHVPPQRLASVSEVPEISQESPDLEDEPNIHDLMQVEDDQNLVTMTVGGIKTSTKEITDQVIKQIGGKENTKMKELEVKITTLETDNKELKTQLAEYQTQASSNKTDTAKAPVNTNLMAIGHQEERSDLTVGGIKTLTKEITDQVIEQIGEKENTKMKELEAKITTLETDNKELKTQLAEYQT